MLLCDGAEVVAEGRPAEPGIEVPEAPAFELAEAASEAGVASWAEGHPFPTCFVCGPERVAGDGLRVFPGAVPGSELFAATWTPEAGANGVVAPELVWAALDCPTSAPVFNPGGRPPIVLARLSVRLDGAVQPGAPHVLLSWALQRDGRKRHAAGALLTAAGELRATARALWIELRG